MKHYSPIFWSIIFVIAIALLSLFYILVTADQKIVYKKLPDFTLESLFDNEEVITSKIFSENDLVIMNFFASWCITCIQEHSILMDMQKFGIEILGIAWLDESKLKTKEFLDTHGNPYSFIGYDVTGGVGTKMGIEAIPETFVIYQNKIIFHHSGALTASILQARLLPQLISLQTS